MKKILAMSLKPKKISFDKTWFGLRSMMKEVLALNDIPHSEWNQRFSDVYEICVAYPEPLADRLYEEAKQFIDDHLKGVLERVISDGNEKLLQNYHDEWKNFTLGVKYLNNLYWYLNHQFIRKQRVSEADVAYGNKDKCDLIGMEIGELCLELWKRNIIIPLEATLSSLILDCVNQERKSDGYTVLRETVKEVSSSFVRVGHGNDSLYKRIVEVPLLEVSMEYYKSLALKWLEDDDISKYMVNVLNLLAKENMLSNRILYDSSQEVLKKCCEDKLIVDYIEFLSSQTRLLIEKERTLDMVNMYDLLRNIPVALTSYVKDFTELIKENGIQTIRSLSGDNIHFGFVDAVLSVHRKYTKIIASSFRNDQRFTGGLDRACDLIVNIKIGTDKEYMRAPELLAKFCDHLLRKSGKNFTETEMEEKLNEAVIIFKYIDDKDVFQKFYSRNLAKRLIYNHSHSMDAEEVMINKLKLTCGYEFTNKLHRMFTDIHLSKTLNEEFFSNLANELDISFSITILQAGAWPLGGSLLTPFVLPPELVNCIAQFEQFYYGKFNGRKLTWLPHLSQGELKLLYTTKPYVLTMQTFQMAILLLFEKKDVLTCDEIRKMVELNDDQLFKNIQSLVDCKLLIQRPNDDKSNELNDLTYIELNMNYTNKRIRGRIGGVTQQKEMQQQESVQTVASADEDRKLFLQATIVRIMKSRRVIKHTELVREVMTISTSFTPTIAMVKKSIETLMEKQYIERTPHSSDEYGYVA